MPGSRVISRRPIACVTSRMSPGALFQWLRDLLPQGVELLEAAVRGHVGPEGPPVDLAPGDCLARAGGGVERLLMALDEDRAVRVHRSQVFFPLEDDPEFVRHPLPEG